jgi:hypothetical protein
MNLESGEMFVISKGIDAQAYGSNRMQDNDSRA